MNKKFSTLMAGLMLASAFSVGAQNYAKEYENGKYYLLGKQGEGYLSVNSTPGSEYGKLSVDETIDGLKDTREALWKVTVTKGNDGVAPKYSFVNVATGMTLSVDEKGSDTPVITGRFMEWLNGGKNSFEATNGEQPLYSYIDSKNIVYFTYDSSNGLKVVKSEYDASKLENAFKVQPWEAAVVDLTADDLNKELITNNAVTSDSFFNLTFDKDVTEDAAKNLFAATPLQAKILYVHKNAANNDEYTLSKDDAKKNPNGDPILASYVRLYSKDNGYLMVDTALHTGSEAEKQLPKFTYVNNPDAEGDPINGNNYSRLAKSANFKFAYEPVNDRVLIKVEKYVKRVQNWDGTPVLVEGEDGNDAYTYWPTGSYAEKTDGNTKYAANASKDKTEETVSDAYVRLVTLSSVRELTVASEAADGSHAKNYNPQTNEPAEWSDPDNLTYGMLTTVKIGQGLMSYVPTTIDSGLYLIQFVKNSANIEAAEGNYYVANLGGAFGYAEQAKNQDYQHIPAAQWYVEKQGTIDSAPLKIWNREFFDNENKVNDAATFGKDYQYQAFQGPDGSVFFRGGAFDGDTVKFIPVTNKTDAKLGYKYVDEKTSTVETYVFNYLHGLAASSEVGLNTPIAKDSLVRVDETGETIAFRLVPVIVDDSYGKQFDTKKTGIANLIRNAYYIKAYDEIKFAEDNRDRYLTYDTKSKKYVMSTTPTAYFLKENNCVGDVHYYALVEAEYFQVWPSNLVDAFKANGTYADGNFYFYPQEFEGMKVDRENEAIKNYQDNYLNMQVTFYDKNGKFITTDASVNVPLYAYQENEDGIIELMIVKHQASDDDPTDYYYMNAGDDYKYVAEGTNDKNEKYPIRYITRTYADNRVSVDDNTLDLTQAVLEDKWVAEIRVSAFAVVENDAPLYRRFNGVAPETYGDASNAPLNLKFYRYNNNAEYLFENYSSENEYRDGITDNSISFLGVNNAFQYPESETRSYTMFVDTAYVRNNTRMPQYLIGVKPEVVEGDTLLCDASTHQHKTPEEALACEHTIVRPSFVRAMYLFNAQDSIDAKNYDYQGKAAYGADKYTRLAFKDAVHAMDTLYILNPGVTTEQLIEANFKNDDLFANKIALDNNKHKNVVFQFRLLDEQDNRFLIESEAEKDGEAVLNKNLDHVCVAPNVGGWVKVQNGVPVIARDLTFNEASSQADVFDVNDEIKYDAVDNEEIAVEGVSVVAGDGQITIMGAAGKNVTITNILGKVVASQVIASDNATIAVPAGIVAVAVEGEAAVKAIVK